MITDFISFQCNKRNPQFIDTKGQVNIHTFNHGETS